MCDASRRQAGAVPFRGDSLYMLPYTHGKVKCFSEFFYKIFEKHTGIKIAPAASDAAGANAF